MTAQSDRQEFLNAITAKLGPVTQITRQQLQEISDAQGVPLPYWITRERIGRGIYALVGENKKSDSLRAAKSMRTQPEPMKVPEAQKVKEMFQQVVEVEGGEVVRGAQIRFVPEGTPGYVPYGNFYDIQDIIVSGRFYPTYITGLSGNGKTIMPEQICHEKGRELFRVNITKETDEDDLIGGFRLVQGETVWQDGPVVSAMERGAILLLDEIDLGDVKMMCLQPVLEGKSIYVKKANKIVRPAPGFNIFATANTKGQGSDDGKFIGTNVMNEAFLERFAITFEQEYPPSKVETKILNNVMGFEGVQDPDFANKLVTWANVIRKTYEEGAVNEIISTRRLVNIVQGYAIFGHDRQKAIQLCLNRFDRETKETFMNLYMKIDEKTVPKVASEDLTWPQETSSDPVPAAKAPAAFPQTPARPTAATSEPDTFSREFAV